MTSEWKIPSLKQDILTGNMDLLWKYGSEYDFFSSVWILILSPKTYPKTGRNYKVNGECLWNGKK